MQVKMEEQAEGIYFLDRRLAQYLCSFSGYPNYI
jgi:hypothetical protein